MKIAYFDCQAGASGDMILGALLDAGLDFEQLKAELAKLPLKDYHLSAEKQVKMGITGTKFDVHIGHHHHDHEDEHHHEHDYGQHDHGHDHEEDHHHHHNHEHHHEHRGLKEITEIIQTSGLDSEIRKTALAIFQRLGRAEAKVHNKSVDEIHFHEVGAVDSIVDIVGAAIGFHLLGIEQVVTTKLHIGTGTVECAHGTLPVPAPATLELLKNIPVHPTGIEAELVTPTGAAILTTLVQTFGPPPEMRILSVGYGVGYHDLPIANLLRVTIGETTLPHESDQVQLIETNIDDMNPQFYDHIMTRLFESGAKDVFLTPIIMKKSRPGVILSVIAHRDDVDRMADVIFSETTTLGVRISQLKKRMILNRDIRKVTTPWGEARVKMREVSKDEKTFEPEYDDCKTLAQAHGVSIQHVYETIKRLAESEG